MYKKLYTLIFIKNKTSLLLGMKTRGLGEGLWNGFGGKPEPNETLAECARRELKEESGLSVALKQTGVATYVNRKAGFKEIVHIFTFSGDPGEFTASEEMDPIKWFPFGSIPYEKMWPDAKAWYPLMLNDEYFNVRVLYEEGIIKNITIQTFENQKRVLRYVDAKRGNVLKNREFKSKAI